MVLKYYFLHARYLLKLEKGDFKNWETRTILISFYPSCRSSPAGYNSDYWNTRRPKRANWIIRWWMEDERRGWSETSARIGTVGRQLAAVATENPRRHNKCAELRPVKRGRWGEALVGGGPGGAFDPCWCRSGAGQLELVYRYSIAARNRRHLRRVPGPVAQWRAKRGQNRAVEFTSSSHPSSS